MPDLVEQILKKRGYKTKAQREEFLNPDYEKGLHDPFLLAGMGEAVKRIEQAIAKQEQIVIYGDYDIDGLSATALLLDALNSFGARVSAYIPDRFEEGYGINTQALEKIKNQGVNLVITVDCGSTSREPITWARDNGLDVIVTDHHEVPPQLPPAVAVINPKRPDSKYPFNDLAGVGVAFKLVCALQKELPGLEPGQEKWLLDLVALGTVCDVVGLTGENRVLTTYGLEVFARTRRMGLRALAAVAGISLADVDTYHFGFILGPRLNAAGRLEHAKLSLELFIAEDKERSLEIARKLDELNAERRRQQDLIFERACAQADKLSADPILVVSDPEWSHGIVGIVAAKLTEKYGKPSIVLQEMGGESKGSARSLGDFSIVEAMRAADELLIKYGGHKMAAGCSLKTADIGKFRTALNRYYSEGGFKKLESGLEADSELEDLGVVNWDTFHGLQLLKPFGMGNPRPLFYMPGARLGGLRYLGNKGQHLKAVAGDGNGSSHDMIAFGMGPVVPEGTATADLWFEIDSNTYRGNTKLQLHAKRIEP